MRALCVLISRRCQAEWSCRCRGAQSLSVFSAVQCAKALLASSESLVCKKCVFSVLWSISRRLLWQWTRCKPLETSVNAKSWDLKAQLEIFSSCPQVFSLITSQSGAASMPDPDPYCKVAVRITSVIWSHLKCLFMRMQVLFGAARVPIKDLQTQPNHRATLLLILTNTAKPDDLLFKLEPWDLFFLLFLAFCFTCISGYLITDRCWL